MAANDLPPQGTGTSLAMVQTSFVWSISAFVLQGLIRTIIYVFHLVDIRSHYYVVIQVGLNSTPFKPIIKWQAKFADISLGIVSLFY